MVSLKKFYAQAKARAGSVVYAEGRDVRIIKAARAVADQKIAQPILLGNEREIRAAAAGADCRLDGLQLIDPQQCDSACVKKFSDILIARKPTLDRDEARTQLVQPLYYGGLMVANGDCDAMIAGAVTETGKVISAGLRTVGLQKNIDRLSSYFLMIVPSFMAGRPKSFIFADCAVNIAPDAAELASIAIASSASATKLLDEQPRLALLSFSTLGSASHERVDIVSEALEIVKKTAPDIIIDGEFQVDAALVPNVATRKVKRPSEVAGKANVLIFPDLNTGNIAYKLVQYMANADAYGPFFQGFAKPVCDLSRGCSVDDIIGATVIMLATS